MQNSLVAGNRKIAITISVGVKEKDLLGHVDLTNLT
jgi:hypothetical protein